MKNSRNIIAALASVVGVALTMQASAWGMIGHRVVGQIADSYLTPKAKAETKKILGNETIAMSSNWMDFIKSDTTNNYLGPWHYVNLPADMDTTQFNDFFAKDTSIDAYTKILWLVKELKTNKLMSNSDRAKNLKLLIHIVGDVHQPMHLGHVEDRGGNGVKVNWFREPVNLHIVWDESLIEYQQLSYTEYAAAINYVDAATLNMLKKRTLVQHLWDTYQLTQKIYKETQPDSKLSYSYNYKFVNDLNNQLLEAGIHLASVLNEIYK